MGVRLRLVFSSLRTGDFDWRDDLTELCFCLLYVVLVLSVCLLF